MPNNTFSVSVSVSVSPETLAAYVEYAGWTKSDIPNSYGPYYVGNRRPGLVIPNAGPDYERAATELINILEELAAEHDFEPPRRLDQADRDAVNIGVNARAIPLSAAGNLIASTRAMCRAAIRYARQQEKISLQTANDFLKQTHLTQNETAAFGITLLVPTTARPITLKLVHGLNAIRGQLDSARSQDDASWSRLDDLGYSANLCGALLKMVESFEELELSFGYALTRPESPRWPARHKIGFSVADQAGLQVGARRRRPDAPTPAFINRYNTVHR